MAAISRRKLSRKQLKEPDEFVYILDRAIDFLSENIARVILAAVVLATAIAGGLGVSLYFQHQQRTAAEGFYRGINALRDHDYKGATRDFTALFQNSPRTHLGRVARLYLGAAYLEQGQPAKARDELQAYVAHAPDALFRQMALTQLGVTDEALGDYRSAHTAYAEAARMTGPEKVRAEIGEARTLALQGNRQGAIDAYLQFLKENPFTPQRTEVIEALAQMGVSAGEPASPGRQIDVSTVSPLVKNPASKPKSQ